MHKLKIEATKFTVVGAANFALTFIVFTAMLKVLGVNYLLSLVAAWVVGMLFSYALNFAWVFKPEQKIQFRAQFVRFFLASVLSIALNMLALRYIVEQTDFDPFYVQMALIPFIVVFNFLTAKFWSLRTSTAENSKEYYYEDTRTKYKNILFYPPLKIENLATTGILLCAFLIIVYCVWTLNRGFEITDEAYYLLLAMHAGTVKFYISAQQWITAGLWQITGSIVLFRAAGMVLLLTSSSLLALGVFSVCARLDLVADRLDLKSVVLAGSAVGGMLYASTINLSPCYNLLASAGAYAAAGMVLLASNRSNVAYKHVFYTLAGCAVGMEALCKASAGMSTFALLVLWVTVFERSRLHKVFGLLAVILGAITFAGITLLVNTTISDATQAVQQGMPLFRMVQVETIGARLVRYFVEFLKYTLISLSLFVIPAVAMLFYVKTRRTFYVSVGLVVLVIPLLFYRYLFAGFNRGVAQSVVMFSMLLMALIVSTPVWSKNRSAFALFFGLILLPYTVSMGTGNALFTQVIDSLAPWGVMISVLVVAHHCDDFNKMVTSLIGMCFMVAILLQVFISGFRPYHMSFPIIKQDHAIAVGNLGVVKVDAETYKFLSDIKAAVRVCHIAPGTTFIGLYNIPGVALALDAIPALTPWLNNSVQAEFVMDQLRSEDMHMAVVGFQMLGNGDFPPLPKQMVAFPLGYRYCGMATYPFLQQSIQIWESQVR